MKYKPFTLKDIYRFPVVVFLWVLVLNNYRKRAKGLLPDEWYWADKKLIDYGYYA
jgi:hypothetical protein